MFYVYVAWRNYKLSFHYPRINYPVTFLYEKHTRQMIYMMQMWFSLSFIVTTVLHAAHYLLKSNVHNKVYIDGSGQLLPSPVKSRQTGCSRRGRHLNLVSVYVFSVNILRIITSLGHKQHGPLHKASCIHPDLQPCRTLFTLQPRIRKRLGHKQAAPATGQSLRGGLEIGILCQAEQPISRGRWGLKTLWGTTVAAKIKTLSLQMWECWTPWQHNGRPVDAVLRIYWCVSSQNRGLILSFLADDKSRSETSCHLRHRLLGLLC